MGLCSPPCHICEVGGPVTCTECDRPLGCHLTPTPMLCPECKQVSTEFLAPPGPIDDSKNPTWGGIVDLEPPKEWPPGRKQYLTFLEKLGGVKTFIETLLKTPDEVRDTLIGELEKAEKRIDRQLATLRDVQKYDLRRHWSIDSNGGDLDDWVAMHAASQPRQYYSGPARHRFSFIIDRAKWIDVKCTNCNASYSQWVREQQTQRRF